MEPPVTPKPMPASSPDLPTNHISKLFSIVYITLTGVVDTIVSWLLACGLEVRKVFFLPLKVSPSLVVWALPAKPGPSYLPKLAGQLPESGSQTPRVPNEPSGIFYVGQHYPPLSLKLGLL
ncbi:hypothetical protein DSO57_1038943 [Entomophthora muscae]|uniref:Uncharacterized protein n=1 Tax=Entomophthora muscae TaxID=34485 RepID=A0ACC2T989_9FUNG|nr:hypothetical protein DSO57_1038943 [Entomophthora muscae]